MSSYTIPPTPEATTIASQSTPETTTIVSQSTPGTTTIVSQSTPETTTIASLPQEIFTYIIFLAALNWPRCTSAIAPWTSLRGVGKPWRSTVDGSPQFWVRLRTPLSKKFVRAALSRSSTSPLLVVSCNTEQFSNISPLIFEHAERIRSLTFRVNDLLLLNESISLDYHIISSLDIQSSDHDGSVMYAPVLPTAPKWHPSLYKLRVLALERIALPITVLSSFRSLVELHLTYDLNEVSFSMPFRPFMLFLHNLPTLKSLVLQMVFKSVEPWFADILFHHLTKLQLRLLIHDAATLVEALHCPNLRYLDIDTVEHVPDDSVARRFLVGARRLASAVPLSISRLRGMPLTLTHTIIKIDQYEGDRGNRTCIRLELESLHRTLARHISFVIEVLDLRDTVKILELDAFSPSIPIIIIAPFDNAAAWTRLLTLLPRLEHLTIETGGCAVEQLPRALSSNATGTVCPLLSLVTFKDGGFYRHQLRPWLDCFLARRDCGHQLDTVSFWSWTIPYHDEWLLELHIACRRIERVMTGEFVFPDDYDSDDYSDSDDWDWSPASDVDA